MRHAPIYGLFLTWVLPMEVMAQLSPGDLSAAHAHLEGISNCTECHDIGNKVPDSKCLNCHDEIRSLVDEDRGYHSSREVNRRTCVDCHSEHHGRKFDMMRFDQEHFDHTKAGYKLQGQHAVIDCRDCHKAEFIDDPGIRDRENTFLGLDRECLNCHEDFHQGTLSGDCISCHDFEAFRPAPGFDHAETDFPLRGMHVDVDCIDCHGETQRQARPFQEFADVVHGECVDCHDNPHARGMESQCSQCHSEEGFDRFTGQRSFDHRITGFELKGKHREANCFTCHKRTADLMALFRDRRGIDENQCLECHEDVHDGKFGTDCAKCHQETGFLDLKTMDFFDHSHTDYPLEGRHLEADCKSCHTGRYTEAIDFSACRNCHEDYHEGVFTEPPPGPDCADCHTVQGFEYTTYGLEEHRQSTFPLEGAHVATPCFACHLKGDKWTFRNIGRNCVDCHEDIHEGIIPPDYYPRQDCARCHLAERWDAITFDHEQTGWPLQGKHLEVTCRACHFEQDVEGTKIQIFEGLETHCAACHENIHGDQFDLEGKTDCTRCHWTNDWHPELFDHDQTDFPLEGKHAEIVCDACHKTILEDGREIVLYKLDRFECIDCHL